MQAKNMELGMATLGDVHAKNLLKMLHSDMGVKNCEEMKVKLMGMMMKLKKEMKNCPIAKELKKKVKALFMMVEKTKVEFDLPKEADVEAWVKKNNFQPWI